jgi:acyl dehydratase
MRHFNGLAEAEAAVGEPLGHSEWHVITQEEISLFADATHDHYWIHTDPEKAAAGPFGATIAHGFLTMSHVPMFIGEVYVIDGLQLVLNYGLNKVRFPAPTPVNSRIRGAVEIAAVERGAKGNAGRHDSGRGDGGLRTARLRGRDGRDVLRVDARGAG